MISYHLEKPLAQSLYCCIRDDIESGAYPSGSKLPSKRQFALDLSLSLSTVEQALDLLEQEGYIECIERRGAFVLEGNRRSRTSSFEICLLEDDPVCREPDFPAALWFKTMRLVMSRDEPWLMQTSPAQGSARLRNVIALYLLKNRSMHVQPSQIVIAAGAQDLYSILGRMFGPGFHAATEAPGYPAMLQIYRSSGGRIDCLPLDDNGIVPAALDACDAQFLQVSPFSSYPQGIVASASRRRKYLSWISSRSGYLIEDDFNSEFFQNGPVLQTLFALDTRHKVIYLNTFSKSLSSSLRLAYMVLPEELLERCHQAVQGLSCTVTMLSQYTLAEFIENGSFERLIARRRRKAARAGMTSQD